MATIKYKSEQVANYDELIAKPFDVKSPYRSTVPLLAYWSTADARLVEVGNALGLPIAQDATLTFEYTVAPFKGRGKASHTDLMILTPSLAIAEEAKYTEPKYETVLTWLGTPAEENKGLVLEGWLEAINKAAGCALTIASVLNLTYQLIHRTASACKPPAERRAVVYHYFDPVDPHQEIYANEFRTLAGLVGAPEKLSFFLYMTTLSKTQEFADLQAEWLRHTPKLDVSADVRRLLRERKVAEFSDPVVERF